MPLWNAGKKEEDIKKEKRFLLDQIWICVMSGWVENYGQGRAILTISLSQNVMIEIFKSFSLGILVRYWNFLNMYIWVPVWIEQKLLLKNTSENFKALDFTRE